MARHRKPRGAQPTVFTVSAQTPGHIGAHRAEPDRTLPKRLSAVAVAVGIVTGAGAAAHAVTSGSFDPVAGGADFGGLPDDHVRTGKVDTVHAIDLGSETARIIRQEQLTALQAFSQASGVAQDGYSARQKAAAEKAAKDAKDAEEARKSPHQRQVEGWVREAIAILAANGTPINEDSVDEIYTIIEKESNGNPNAVNTWDSNAARGTPSKGLMQCIDPTFQAFKLPGHDNILNPVDNIIAGVRYTYARYGGFDRHPGLVGINNGTGYRGY
ncbi:transglycosylase-like protein with SLT domain [Saccharothrix australiensis]|uniref:Transglycosylase-like protein with SLT domain n=1 Tax=Saccharothrix australiensis TaxID=2072 RepID=A0A495W2W5_9PSEU|nr:transglycosylase SLT domain-containing protein [Saccharothrix australiensis]RKT55450.1 transglycosylase-like protein with SLT domain [Saccharothrix australiensis]